MKWFSSFLTPLLLFVFCFFIYLHNLSWSVYGGDVGDLVTAAFVGGVAHPPGYPLFTFLAFLLTRINFATPAFLVGLISLFSGVGSVILFYLTIWQLTKKQLVSLITTGIFAFQYLFWFYNEIAEVFALHTFFTVALFYLAINFALKKQKKFWYLFCLILGLSVTNHQTIVLFVPSFLFIISVSWKNIKDQLFKYLLGLVFVVLGFSVYLYIPLAASMHPIINWDNVHNLSSFFHLLLRKDYGTLQAGNFAKPDFWERVIILKSYFFTITTQITIPVVAISIVGFFILFKKNWQIALAFLLAFIFSGPLFVTYAGFPLVGNFYFGVYERFFTMSSIVVIYFFPFGLLKISEWFGKLMKRKVYVIFFQSIFFVIPFFLFIYNFPKTNLSNIWIGDNLGYDILSSLPGNSTLILGGDTVLFNTQYVHYALKVRPDIKILNVGNLQNDPFLSPFTKIYDKTHPKSNLNARMMGTIREVEKKYSVFSGVQLQPAHGEKFIWIPYGLVYKLVSSKKDIPNESAFLNQNNKIWSRMHIPKENTKALGSLTIADIPSIYSDALLATGAFIQTNYHDATTSEKYYKKSIVIFPDNTNAYNIIGLFYFTQKKNCNLAKNNFSKSLELDSSNELTYMLLYTTYIECFNDKKSAENLAKKFKDNFGQDIILVLKRTIEKKKLL